MGKTGFFVGNDAGHVVTPCERRVKAKSRVNKGKKILKNLSMLCLGISNYMIAVLIDDMISLLQMTYSHFKLLLTYQL